MSDRRLNPYIIAALLVVAVWFSVADTVFRFRHPWATETQRFIYFLKALAFQRVDCPYATPPETSK